MWCIGVTTDHQEMPKEGWKHRISQLLEYGPQQQLPQEERGEVENNNK